MKGYKLSISNIATDTYNAGQNRFAAQFTQSRKCMANYLQRTAAVEGYLVTEMVRTKKVQTIKLPPAVDPDDANVVDLAIIRAKEVKTVAK